MIVWPKFSQRRKKFNQVKKKKIRERDHQNKEEIRLKFKDRGISSCIQHSSSKRQSCSLETNP